MPNNTDVMAFLNKDGVLTLTAEDGCNIDVTFNGANTTGSLGYDASNTTAAQTLANQVTATSSITLQSNELFELGDIGTDVAAIGFSSGVFGVNSDDSVSSLDVSRCQ